MNIFDLWDHPDVSQYFEGESWEAWRSFVAALFGLPMDDGQLALFREHTGRQSAPTDAFREAALVIGRRGGKSRVLALIATYLAVGFDYTAKLPPGSKAMIAIMARDKSQAGIIFDYISGLMDAVPALAMEIEARTADTLTLRNGVRIAVFAASFRGTRGYSLVAALCDEIAFWLIEGSANPDEEVLRALRPGLGNLRGLLLIASSPYAKRGVLYTSWREHYGRDDARVLVWQASTLAMNPAYDPEEVKRAYEADPFSAAAEYDAQFRSDIAGFVTREIVDACTVPGRYELPKIPGCRYVAFTDPSGGSADSFTLAIAHPDPKDRTVGILDAVRDMKPPFSPEGVVVEFAALLKTYGIANVTGDRYAGEWPREQFRKLGIAYNLSEKPKSDLYRDTLPLLNSGKLELLDLKTLTTQLVGLERRTARGGRDSIDHGPGGRDDVVNAAMGALLLATTGRAPMRISAAAIENMGMSSSLYEMQRRFGRGS